MEGAPLAKIVFFAENRIKIKKLEFSRKVELCD